MTSAVAGVPLRPVVTGGDQGLGQQHREVGNGSHREGWLCLLQSVGTDVVL